ncbi:phytase [Parvularcula marina]|nr:phytase [Parvularcula marina]
MKPTLLLPALLLTACASMPIGYEPIDEMPETDLSVPAVTAKVETASVDSSGDAADDPAIWIDPRDASRSLVLGTDKQAGLYSYDLTGNVVQFIPSGALNNVDLRQRVTVGGWLGDLAAATNRTDNSVTLFTIRSGEMTEMGRFPAARKEPYGFCMGYQDENVLMVVTHKNGEVDLFRLDGFGEPAQATLLQTVKMESQLEGCVFDEPNAALYVGEENAGITRYDLNPSAEMPLTGGRRIDVLGSDTGIVADIEGLAIYRQGETGGYLIASSQGNNTYAVYKLEDGTYLGRFSIGTDEATGIDGAEETDGIEASSAALPGYPKGVFLVQDGFNMPEGSTQNYKYVDWRDIEAALDLE